MLAHLKTPCMSVALVRCWRGLSASSEDQDRCQCLQVFNTIFLANPTNNVLVIKKQRINNIHAERSFNALFVSLRSSQEQVFFIFFTFFRNLIFPANPNKDGSPQPGARAPPLVWAAIQTQTQTKMFYITFFNLFWWAIQQLIRFAIPFFLWFQNNPWKTCSDVILRVDSWWRAQHDPEPEVRLIFYYALIIQLRLSKEKSNYN